MGKTSDELGDGIDESRYGATEPVVYGDEVSNVDPDDEPDEVSTARAKVEETRSRMTETVDAIEDKLHPAKVAQRTKEAVVDATVGKAQQAVSAPVDTAKNMGSGLMDTVRQNPVPAALAALGLGWLYMSGRKSDSPSDYRANSYRGNTYDYQQPYSYEGSYRYGYRGDYREGDSGGVGGALSQAHDKAGDIAGQAQSKVSDVASTAQDKMSQVGDQAQQVASQAQYGAYRAQSGFQQMLQEQPLGVAAAAVAIGAAVGLAIPSTPKEQELMGETRDNLMQKAQETAQEKVQQVQSVAQEVASSAKETAQHEAQNQGLTQ